MSVKFFGPNIVYFRAAIIHLTMESLQKVLFWAHQANEEQPEYLFVCPHEYEVIENLMYASRTTPLEAWPSIFKPLKIYDAHTGTPLYVVSLPTIEPGILWFVTFPEKCDPVVVEGNTQPRQLPEGQASSEVLS